MIASGFSSAQFFNAATYATGVLFSAGGSGTSFVGAGHVVNTFNVSMVENANLNDTATIAFSFGADIVDGVQFTDTKFFPTDAPLSTNVIPSVAIATHVSSSMTFHAGVAYVWTPGGLIVETVRLGGSASAVVHMHVVMTERLKVAQGQVIRLMASITEHFTLSPVFIGHLGTVLLNRMLLSDIASAQMRYAVAQAEGMYLAAILARFTGATLNDGFMIHDTASQQYIAVAQLMEFLTLTANQSYAMCFRISVADGVEIDDAMLLKMIYQGVINEILEIEVLYQSLGAGMTAWTINTRTGAVTEYQGWNFNSFVSIGNKYVAASKDGLYELDGPTDNGLSVIADIMGGFLQPAGAHLSGLKGVYLGQTGQGYWLLKIQTGDGREYVYQRLSNPALMTTKFTIGKGINARYIGWELINVEGQDFDIDTIEFVPMVRARRI